MSEKAGIKLNTKTWHYKLIKYVLGDDAPTPKNMHNLCPYFWLMIFSMFVGPFKLFFTGLGKILGFIFNWSIKFVEYILIEPTASGWFNSLEDRDVYALSQHDKKIPNLYSKSKLGKKANGYEKSRADIVNEWFKKTHKESIYVLDKYGSETSFSTEKYKSWKNFQRLQKLAIDKEIERLVAERRANRTIKVDEVGEKIGESVTNAFNVMASWTDIIKWTKRVVGAIITLIGFGGVYFVVNFLGRGILWVVENFNGPVVLSNLVIFGKIILGIVIVGVLFYFIRLWVLYVKEQGLKLWYVKMIYYPIYWLIFIPIKFLFVDLLFEFFLINLLKGIVAGAKGIWVSLLGFLGIFGEYFGASYTDYCPGIEWEENDKKDK